LNLRFAGALLCAASPMALAPLMAQDIAASTAASPTPPAEASAVVAMVIPTVPANVLPAGTNVRLRLLSALTSQTARAGERFDLEVAEDVMLGGVVIIPRGSPASGEVTKVRHKGMWGRSGGLETRLLSIRANGVVIPIRGAVAERGETGTAGVVASILVAPVVGFFVTGTSAVLPVGTGYAGVTETDLPVILPAT
jgi:hypothetical protein